MHLPYPTAHRVPLILAPMAGVSESPFRQLCRRFGADVVVSEFISAVGITLGLERVLKDLHFEPVERPIGIQIYGADPDVMVRAAVLVSERVTPDFIDINFGCPVKKVVRNNGGSGCLKDLSLVQRIITSVAAATALPVTVKIRSGWDEPTRDPVAIALRCQDAGARALTLHPRTRTQLYTGHAAWDEIARVVEALDIPVIGNGDVHSPEDVVQMQRETGCAGVMIARGSFGNPWVFSQARDLLEGRPMRSAPTPAERFATALEHARLAVQSAGDQRKTVIEFRKHLGWYTSGLRGAAELRQRLLRIESMAEAAELFAGYLERRVLEPAA
jgi:nifR3 family TIM-barrel protein